MPSCPECGGQRVWKDGIRYVREGSVQRFLCRSCGYRFSEPKVKVNVTGQVSKRSKPHNNLPHNVVSELDFSFKEPRDYFSLLECEDVTSHERTVTGQGLNVFCDYSSTRRVCASEREAKNLVEVETRFEAAQRESTKKAEVKGKIVEFMWKLKRERLSEGTIRIYAKYLKMLHRRGANVLDPESVKDVIAVQDPWKNKTKSLAVAAYNRFAIINGMSWKPPKYKATQKLPFIHLETEIDSLIAFCGKKIATILQLLKETGMRIGEALRLKWLDIDFERNTITLNETEKNGKPRMFKASGKLIAMINRLPKKNEKVFATRLLSGLGSDFCKARKRAAAKLQNPRLKRISFHTIRHWKATTEYAKTKDILHVKELLGHRSLNNTLIYTQVINFETDEYHSATAKTIEEATRLIEAGLEYVCEMENCQLFRKRK